MIDLQNLITIYNELIEEYPWKLYNEKNLFFAKPDAIEYSMMIKYLKPKNIIEVGAGNSSCVAQDINNLNDADNKFNLTLIDPSPRIDITEIDCKFINKMAQDVSISEYLILRENDILFIDSSHTYSDGSDCKFIIEELIPQLMPGVFIYFHDVFWPMRYPTWWLKDKGPWNEIYYIRKLIENNRFVNVELHTKKLISEDLEWVEKNMPEILDEPFLCGGIWLKKI